MSTASSIGDDHARLFALVGPYTATEVTPPPPSYAISSIELIRPEGSSTSVGFTFAVIRTGDLTSGATLNYSVTGAGPNPATSFDFLGGAMPSGSVTFAASESMKQIVINVLPDLVVESNEQFVVSVTGESGSLTATATILDDDGTKSPLTIRTIQSTGSDANRIDIVVLGDGYTISELSTTYSADISNMLKYLFAGGLNSEPFNRYKNFFNVYAVDVISAESGVDNKGTGVVSNTSLDGRYFFDGITDRLLGVEFGVTLATMNWALKGTSIHPDIRFVSANSSVYGGGGGYFTVFAGGNSNAAELSLHELGHSFVNLADQYSSTGTGGIGGDIYSGAEPTQPDISSDPTGTKWAEWVGYSQDVVGIIGAYEGGGYYNHGIYRPSINSKMRSLGNPFDAIGREQFVLKFYSLVDPLDSYTSNSVSLTDPAGLDAKVIDPAVVGLRWAVDGIFLESTNAHLDTRTLNVASGNHKISVLAYDPTEWVRGDRSSLEQTVIWDVTFSQMTQYATAAHLNLVGGPFIDTLIGTADANLLNGGGGNDILDGGAGTDTAVLGGDFSSYLIRNEGGGNWTVEDKRSTFSDGTDLLINIEILQFTDRYLWLTSQSTISTALDAAFANILRADSMAAINTSLAADLGQRITTGMLDLTGAIQAVVKAANASTSVATLAYEFFTGKIPSLGGMDYLVSPTGQNVNNLNSAYYQAFNLENRYINFAVNLGKLGEGAPAFAAKYAALDLYDATKTAYATIFGSTPTDAKVHALIDTRTAYFAAYGQDGANGVGTKAAMVGWLLAEAVKADVGTYATANHAFLTDLADGAAFGVDLIGVYKGTPYDG